MNENNLFVYGTLMGNGMHRVLNGAVPKSTVNKVTDAYIEGFNIYDLVGFPGVTVSNDVQRRVYGEVWNVHPGVLPKVLERLDVYEGVSNGLYSRTNVAATDIKGRVRWCHLYLLLRNTNGYQRIENGSWHTVDNVMPF